MVQQSEVDLICTHHLITFICRAAYWCIIITLSSLALESWNFETGINQDAYPILNKSVKKEGLADNLLIGKQPS